MMGPLYMYIYIYMIFLLLFIQNFNNNVLLNMKYIIKFNKYFIKNIF